MNKIRTYIIIDDDPFSNALCTMILKSTLGGIDTKIFTAPEEALSYIGNEYVKDMQPTVLLLDINMPTLNAWGFLERYEKFDEKIKEQISIYILSSSVDQRDKDKARSSPHVKGFISKPLNRQAVLAVAGA